MEDNNQPADTSAETTAAPAAEVEVPAVTVIPTVEQTRDIFVPAPKWNDDAITLNIPNQTVEETNDVLNAMPNIDFAQSESGRALLHNLQQANFAIPHGGYYAEITKRLGSLWVQDVQSEVGPLMAMRPRMANVSGKKLVGEAALNQVRNALGMGTQFKVPLYHTGIWLTVKAATETELLELNRKLSEDKIRLGRETHGLAFSNTSVFFAATLADFVIKHIYDSNLIENELTWYEVIKVTDLPILVWAMAYTVWPNGFQYSRVKLDGTGATEMEEALMKLGAVQFTDTQSLTERQRSHMSKHVGSKVNLETIRMYQEQFLRGQKRVVDITDGLSLELAVPTLAQYINNGTRWVNDIITMVDTAFAMPPTDKKRSEYINENGLATDARQFAHWISAVIAGGERIEEEEDIERALDAISADEDYVKKFREHVREYTEDSTISVIATPRSEFSEPATLTKRFPNLLVMDPMTTFFILLLQKTQMLAVRNT